MAAPDVPPRTFRYAPPGPDRGASRNAWTALTLFVVGAVLVLFGVTGTYTDTRLLDVPAGSSWFLLPLGITCAAVLLPLRRPLVSLLVGVAGFGLDVVMGGSTGVVLAFVNVLYWSYTGLSARGQAWLERVATGVAVAGAAAVAISERSPAAGLGTLLTGGALLLVPIWWARDVERSRQFARLDLERAAELARLDTERAVREERSAMARDLHDVVAGHLSAIALQSEAALAAARAAGRDTTVLAGIRSASVESLQEMRTMIHVMRQGAPGESAVTAPGLAGLPHVVRVARTGGLDVELTGLDGVLAGEPPVAPVVGQAVHRIVQEALTNARKHAGPGRVEVGLSRSGDEVLLVVRSPSSPVVEGTRTGGHGLATMAERVDALAGEFSAGPADGGGWVVRAGVPAAGPLARVVP